MKWNVIKYVVAVCTSCVFVFFCSCRSSKHDNYSFSEQIKKNDSLSSVRRDSSASVSETNDRSTVVTKERQYLRSVSFDSLGRISNIQESWRDYGSGRMDESKGRQGTVSVSAETAQQKSTSGSYTKASGESESNTDSRPVQGVEWGYIALAALFVFNIIRYLKNIRK